MKRYSRILKIFFILLSICVFFPAGISKTSVNANEKTPTWTATTKSKTYYYTGKKVQPKVTVKYKGAVLKSNNYIITYSKNPQNPGTYKIKITLKGSYKGKKLKGVKYIKYAIKIAKPTRLQYSYYDYKYSGGSLYCTWDSSLNADGYTIEVRNNGTLGKKLEKAKCKSFYNSYSVSVNECGIKYLFCIRAYKKIGKKVFYSDWSKIHAKIPLPNYKMTTKRVNGIDVAYNTKEFPFFKYTESCSKNKTSKKFAQCYFPIFIKQKINNKFVIHTQYNGKCGFNNFSHKQYIPNRKSAQVVTDMSVTYFDGLPTNNKLQQTLYKKGYIGYIMVNASCLLNSKQVVSVYFGDKLVVSLTSNGYSKSTAYDSYKYSTYNEFIEPAYSYSTEAELKSILKDVGRCSAHMTDFETYTALKYWILSHSYSQFTCWGAATVGEVMTELGYAYTPLFCSYSGKNGLYNDYTRYFSTKSKKKHNYMGHMITLIYMKPGKYLYCEVQGSSSSTNFKFNPSGWTRPNYSLDSALTSATEGFQLNEYSTIEKMMVGDYKISVMKYKPTDWHTWMTGLDISF